MLEIDISQIVLHEGDEPNALVDLLDTEPLTGQHRGDVDLLTVHADAPTGGHQEDEGALPSRRSLSTASTPPAVLTNAKSVTHVFGTKCLGSLRSGNFAEEIDEQAPVAVRNRKARGRALTSS